MGNRSTASPAARAVSPYIGLSYYTEADAEWFFGRDVETRTIIGNLRAARLTVVYAPSGVGKSSMLRAGVMSQLRQLAQHRLANRGSAGYVPVVFSAWKDDPLADLIAAIEDAVQPSLAQGGRADLPRALAPAIEAAASLANAELLIVLDQFEEYMLYRTNESAERSFVDQLAACVNNPELRANFLIAIREDAYPGLGDLFAGKIANVYRNYLQLDYLDRDAARAAIVRPIERFNHLHPEDEPIQIEQELVEAVLDEVRAGEVLTGQADKAPAEGSNGAGAQRERIETPYLQLVMFRLWDHEREHGSRVLQLATLQELGGAREIVRTHLDGALDALAPEDYDAALDLFHYLVTPSGTKIVYTASDLAELAHRPYDRVAALLAGLAGEDKRIVRHVPPPAGKSSPADRYEIFHDVLAPAVVDWRRRALDRRRGAEDARERQRLEHERHEAEQRTRAEERRRRAFQRLAVAALALLLVAVLLGVFAWLSRKSAVSNEKAAQSNQLVASSEQTLTRDPELSTELALRAMRLKDSPQAEAALRAAVPELQELKTLHAGSPVNAVAFSPDGSEVAAAAEGGAASVWELATARRLHLLDPHDGPVSSLAFSPNGSEVAIGNKGGTASIASVWDLATGARVRVLRPDDGRVYGVAFSPDGRELAVATKGGAVSVWDLATGARVWRTPPSSGGAVNSVAFNPHGTSVLTASEDGAASIWNPTTNEPPRVLRSNGAGLESAAFNPAGTEVVTAGADGVARLWDAEDGSRPLMVFSVLEGAVLGAAFSPDGSELVTANQDGTARIWNAASGKLLMVLSGSEGPVRDAAFSPDGREVATASEDGTVRIWDASPRERLTVLHGSQGAVIDASFNRSGTKVVTANQDGSATIWDLASGRHVQLQGDSAPVYSAVFNPQGTEILTASHDGTARIWSVQDDRLLTPLSAGAPLNSAAFNRTGTEVVTASKDGDTAIWSARGGPPLEVRRGRGGSVEGAAFNPAGTEVVTANENGTAMIWDPAARRATTLSAPEAILSAAFNPAGTEVVTGGKDGTARIWDAATGKQFRPIDANAGPIYSVAFSPDGRELMTASSDGELAIWELADRKQLTVLSGHEGVVFSAAFNAAGTEVVAGDQDGNAAIWSAELTAPIQSLERTAASRLTHGLSRRQHETYLPR